MLSWQWTCVSGVLVFKRSRHVTWVSSIWVFKRSRHQNLQTIRPGDTSMICGCVYKCAQFFEKNMYKVYLQNNLWKQLLCNLIESLKLMLNAMLISSYKCQKLICDDIIYCWLGVSRGVIRCLNIQVSRHQNAQYWSVRAKLAVATPCKYHVMWLKWVIFLYVWCSKCLDHQRWYIN